MNESLLFVEQYLIEWSYDRRNLKDIRKSLKECEQYADVLKKTRDNNDKLITKLELELEELLHKGDANSSLIKENKWLIEEMCKNINTKQIHPQWVVDDLDPSSSSLVHLIQDIETEYRAVERVEEMMERTALSTQIQSIHSLITQPRDTRDSSLHLWWEKLSQICKKGAIKYNMMGSAISSYSDNTTGNESSTSDKSIFLSCRDGNNRDVEIFVKEEIIEEILQRCFMLTRARTVSKEEQKVLQVLHEDLPCFNLGYKTIEHHTQNSTHLSFSTRRRGLVVRIEVSSILEREKNHITFWCSHSIPGLQSTGNRALHEGIHPVDWIIGILWPALDYYY